MWWVKQCSIHPESAPFSKLSPKRGASSPGPKNVIEAKALNQHSGVCARRRKREITGWWHHHALSPCRAKQSGHLATVGFSLNAQQGDIGVTPRMKGPWLYFKAYNTRARRSGFVPSSFSKESNHRLIQKQLADDRKLESIARMGPYRHQSSNG